MAQKKLGRGRPSKVPDVQARFLKRLQRLRHLKDSVKNLADRQGCSVAVMQKVIDTLAGQGLMLVLPGRPRTYVLPEAAEEVMLTGGVSQLKVRRRTIHVKPGEELVLRIKVDPEDR